MAASAVLTAFAILADVTAGAITVAAAASSALAVASAALAVATTTTPPAAAASSAKSAVIGTLPRLLRVVRTGIEAIGIGPSDGTFEGALVRTLVGTFGKAGIAVMAVVAGIAVIAVIANMAIVAFAIGDTAFDTFTIVAAAMIIRRNIRAESVDMVRTS